MRVGAFKTLRKKHLKKLDDGNIAVGYLINILIKYKDKLRINIADAFLRILENVNLEKSQINQIENFFSTLESVHDMAYPIDALRKMRDMVSENGVVLIGV